jgi:hypothetical protein
VKLVAICTPRLKDEASRNRLAPSLTASGRRASLPLRNRGGHVTTPAPAFNPPHSTVNIFPKPAKSATMAETGLSSSINGDGVVVELSGSALELLRVGGGLALYRGRQSGSDAPILVVAPARDPQTPADQRRTNTNTRWPAISTPHGRRGRYLSSAATGGP